MLKQELSSSIRRKPRDMGVILYVDNPLHSEKGKAILNGFVVMTNNVLGFSMQIGTAHVPWSESRPGLLARTFVRRKSRLEQSPGLVRLAFVKEVEQEVGMIDCGTIADFYKALEELKISRSEVDYARIGTLYRFNPLLLKKGFEIYSRVTMQPEFIEGRLKEDVVRRFESNQNIQLKNTDIDLKFDARAFTVMNLAFDAMWKPVFRTWQVRQRDAARNRVKRSETITALGVTAEILIFGALASLVWFYSSIGFSNILIFVAGAGITAAVFLISSVGRYLHEYDLDKV